MAKVKIGKPPQGLTGEQLGDWYADQYEDAYEKQLFDHREARRKAEATVEEKDAEIGELKKNVAEEGDVLLKGDDAQKWNELQKIDVEKLQAQAEEGQRVAKHAFLREAAEAAGYNPRTFTELAELKGMEIEAEQADGKTTYKVKTKDGEGKDTTVPLTEHFEAAYADWLPALTNADRGGAQPPRRAATPPTGRLPSDGGRHQPEDVQQRVLQQANERRQAQKNVLLQSFTPPKNDGGNG